MSNTKPSYKKSKRSVGYLLMTVVFLMWLAGVCLIHPITKRILKEHDRFYARYQDDNSEYLLIIHEA